MTSTRLCSLDLTPELFVTMAGSADFSAQGCCAAVGAGARSCFRAPALVLGERLGLRQGQGAVHLEHAQEHRRGEGHRCYHCRCRRRRCCHRCCSHCCWCCLTCCIYLLVSCVCMSTCRRIRTLLCLHVYALGWLVAERVQHGFCVRALVLGSPACDSTGADRFATRVRAQPHTSTAHGRGENKSRTEETGAHSHIFRDVRNLWARPASPAQLSPGLHSCAMPRRSEGMCVEQCWAITRRDGRRPLPCSPLALSLSLFLLAASTDGDDVL